MKSQRIHSSCLPWKDSINIKWVIYTGQVFENCKTPHHKSYDNDDDNNDDDDNNKDIDHTGWGKAHFYESQWK